MVFNEYKVKILMIFSSVEDEHIRIQNIYYMLWFAFQNLKMADSEKLETEELQNALDLFAEILGIGVGQQLKQGLYREYLDESEDTTMMHGRLNKVL